jgi:hypothetical protein
MPFGGSAMRVLGRLICIVAVASLTISCWQSTDVNRSGQVLDFAIGASKREIFDIAILNQADGQILDLVLIDEPPSTYDEKYKGIPITPATFSARSALTLRKASAVSRRTKSLLDGRRAAAS